MIRRRLCYLLMLGAGSYFILLYDFQGLRFLFGCVACIPIVSFLFLVPMCFFCRVRLAAGRDAIMRGEELEAMVTVENKGFLPVPGIMLELRWRVQGEGEVRSRKWLHGIGMKGKERFSPGVSAGHCGMASLVVAKVRVCDYLGIFSLPAGKKDKLDVCILPAISPLSSFVEEACSQVLQGKGGEREGDMLLRGFQPGDSLHRVYWKLMAKGSGLQVMDFERSSHVSLFLHFSHELEERAEEWDRYLDRAVSILYFFAEGCQLDTQVLAEVVWRQEDAYYRSFVQDGGAVQAWMYAMLRGEEVGTALPAEEIPLLGQGWHLEEDCRLYFGEQCVYEE